MLHPFVSSGNREDALDQVGRVSFSVIVHATLIIGAVVLTRVSDTTSMTAAGEIGLPPAEHLQFVSMTPATSRAADRASRHVQRLAAKASRLGMPTLPKLAPLAIGAIADVVAPPIDFAQQTAQWAAEQLASGPASRNVITDVLRQMYAPVAANPNAVYSRDVVEKIATPYGDNPRPPYPIAMLSAGIETSVRVQFVVDSLGRVEDKSMSFPATAQHMFVEAIKFALKHSRYFPAEFAGRHVAQTVSQDFVFRIYR